MNRTEFLVRKLIDQACQQAHGKPVLEVWIAAAKCAQLDEGHLRFAWDQQAAGTPCHGARIHYREVPFIQKCTHCGHVFAAEKQNAPCPVCHTRHTATLLGEECAIIERLEAYSSEAA